MKKQKSSRSKTRKSNRKSAGSVRGGNEGCAVILAYKDGEKFIKEQIDSLHRQTHDDFHIYIHDDASDLPFTTVMNRQALPTEKTTIHTRKKNVGLTRNFFQGLEACGSEHAYYAFCDQDDIWHDDKLARAVAWLERQPDGPALYFSSRRIVDSAGKNPVAKPVVFTKPIIFANALVQPLASGNTIVMNKTARDLLVDTSRTTLVVIFDWWTSLIIAGAGGNIHFDPEPSIDHRQHDSNYVGANLSTMLAIRRSYRSLGGLFRQWTDTHVAALNKHRKFLTPENRRILDQFATARKAWLPARIIGLRRSGICRQSLAGNIKLFVLVLLGKV